MRRMVETKALRIIVLLAPGDCLFIDIDTDVEPYETATAEIVVAQPMRPPSATRADIENARSRVRQSFGEHEHPEIAGVAQKVCLVVEDAVANPDPHAQVIGRQVAKFRNNQPGNDIESVDRRFEVRVEGQARRRWK